ncbi:hypothetical protein C8J57DRAFT_1713560 [Mycena rebaudengoi]|nr:hypothetical protein C8J57DRAFT_1713560 [Mycena rebaudengoi]
MTSGAKKEKARKKARAQKLLEEQQRVEKETAQRVPGNTPIPLPAATAPIPEPFPPANDDPHRHAWYPDPHRPIFDASPLVFDDDEPVPSTTQIHAFIYAHVSRSPSPPPTRYVPHDDVVNNPPVRVIHDAYAPPSTIPRCWSDDVPELATICTVYVTPSAPAPRDFSVLRSTSAHPWRTIRCRNHRLLPQRRDQRLFPRSLPKRTPAPTPAVVHAIEDTIPLNPDHICVPDEPYPISHPILVADNPPHADEPIPVLVLPRALPLPWDPYYFIPTDYPTADRSLPGETFYGPVQSGLALVCAREYPWIALARANISEIAWGAHPPDELDEREEVLDLLPPDQLVFLMVLVEICHLEPDFAGFVEPAITDFVNAWLDHCWSAG